LADGDRARENSAIKWRKDFRLQKPILNKAKSTFGTAKGICSKVELSAAVVEKFLRDQVVTKEPFVAEKRALRFLKRELCTVDLAFARLLFNLQVAIIKPAEQGTLRNLVADVHGKFVNAPIDFRSNRNLIGRPNIPCRGHSEANAPRLNRGVRDALTRLKG